MRSRRFAALRDTEGAPAVTAISELLLPRYEERFVTEIVAAVRRQVPELSKVPHGAIDDLIRTNLRHAFAAIDERRPPSDEDLAYSAGVAANLARAGISLDTLLNGHRAATRRACELLSEAGAKVGLDPEARLDSVNRLWEWAAAIQVSDAEAHRSAEVDITGGRDEERAWFVRGLLHGTLTAAEVTARATAYGLLPGAVYRAFRARPASSGDERAMARAIEASGGDDGIGVLIASVEGDLCGAVARPPRVDVDGVVGLGAPAELAKLDSSFQLATRALATALAFGYEGVVTLDDLSLRPAILTETHLGERMIRRYFDPLSELGEFGAALEDTVREYLAHGMRIDQSAKALFVHPNTLRHRLDRFQQLTGADLRNTQHVLELWWALERRRLDQDG